MSTTGVLNPQMSPGRMGDLKAATRVLPASQTHANRWKRIDVSWDYSSSGDQIQTSVNTLPDPSKWGRAIALVTVEALSGTRSIFQLQRWLTPELFEALRRRIALNVRLDGKAEPSTSPIARSSRTCRVSDTVAETTHVISIAGRSRGVCVRLEACRNQWLVTAIEIA